MFIILSVFFSCRLSPSYFDVFTSSSLSRYIPILKMVPYGAATYGRS